MATRSRQAGLVSVIVTMILMLVISLMVLGFSQVSRREQRENLDRKLSTQAFLAAETGINDATRSIRKAVADGTTIQPKTNCATTPADANYPYNPVMNAADNVKYTCLLVTPTPTNAKVDVPANGSSQVVNVEPVSAMDRIAFRWTNKVNPTAAQLAGCGASASTPAPTYPPIPTTFRSISSGNWTCPYGVIRIDIVPTPIGTTMTRAMLEAGQKTIFLYPFYDSTGGLFPSANYSTSPNFDGHIYGMGCGTTANACRFDVSGLTGSRYMVRLMSYYAGGDMQVEARLGGTSLGIRNSQIQIDATGRAQDVLRRVQVRLPVNSFQGTVPDYAIASASSICKRFESTGGALSIPNSIQGQDAKNPMCVPLTPPPPPTCSVATDIILEVDTSLSMNKLLSGTTTRRAKELQLLKQFVGAVNISSSGPNRAGLIGFSGWDDRSTPMIDNTITAYTPLTSDVSVLSNAIDTLPQKYGTDFLPPLSKTDSALLQGAYRASSAKTLIFMSDGENDGSPVDDDAVVAAKAAQLKAAGITIYAIAISTEADQATMQSIASPGKFFFANDTGSFDAAIAQITAAINCP